jgi:hypothetical protein
MASVAIISPRPEGVPCLLSWVEAAGYRVVEINNWQQIDFGSVGDDGSTDCLLDGVPLQAFTAVIFYGAPDSYASAQLPQTIDQIFVKQERNQAVLAAILGSKTKLVNCGFWVDFHRILSEPEAQLRMLSAIGWQTPTVIWDYDFLRTYQEKRRVPEPDKRALLVLTRRRYILIPDEVWCMHLCTLIKRTQEFMSDFDLDWCVIALGSAERGTIAYGIRAELPDTLSVSVAKELIRDAIGAAQI